MDECHMCHDKIHLYYCIRCKHYYCSSHFQVRLYNIYCVHCELDQLSDKMQHVHITKNNDMDMLCDNMTNIKL
ncbi:MAG TPA: hypothetical protein VLG50_07855 [Candidatus Saccharimonadales bacterium]|nr:hypothetical protein [Candidatus Saccharimonadales bacterium]